MKQAIKTVCSSPFPTPPLPHAVHKVDVPKQTKSLSWLANNKRDNHYLRAFQASVAKCFYSSCWHCHGHHGLTAKKCNGRVSPLLLNCSNSPSVLVPKTEKMPSINILNIDINTWRLSKDIKDPKAEIKWFWIPVTLVHKQRWKLSRTREEARNCNQKWCFLRA